jgi:archaellum component FlaF (FlaF/FlaG flagellin family)
MRQQQLQILRNGIQGAARMGKTYAVVGALILTIIGVLIIYGGVQIMMDKHTLRVDANITQATCRPQANSPTEEHICSVVVSYPIKDKIMTQNIPRLRNQGNVNIGDVMTIYVNPAKPEDITSMGPSRGLAIALLVIGSLIIFFAILYVSFMLSYKGLAALSAVRKIWNT